MRQVLSKLLLAPPKCIFAKSLKARFKHQILAKIVGSTKNLSVFFCWSLQTSHQMTQPENICRDFHSPHSPKQDEILKISSLKSLATVLFELTVETWSLNRQAASEKCRLCLLTFIALAYLSFFNHTTQP